MWKKKHQLDQKCSAIDATCNKSGKKGHYTVICQKGKGLSCSSKSAHIVKTMNNISTEPDYYTECRELVYVQSHMLQTVCSKHQKIPEKSKLDNRISDQFTLQRPQSKRSCSKLIWVPTSTVSSRNIPKTLSSSATHQIYATTWDLW